MQAAIIVLIMAFAIRRFRRLINKYLFMNMSISLRSEQVISGHGTQLAALHSRLHHSRLTRQKKV